MWFTRRKRNEPEASQGQELQKKRAENIEGANSYIDNYLSYYVSRQAPGYAVLVTGDWGVGKTYKIRGLLSEEKANYVSLFSLNSIEEIEAAVFAQMFPNKASLKGLSDKISAINLGVPGYGSVGINGLASLIIGNFVKTQVDAAKPIIFDDLERCSVKLSKILGVINRYVEHHGCRVIVIAHEKKIVDSFQNSKEKIFGHTLRLEPDIDGAYGVFCQLSEILFGKFEGVDIKSEVLGVFKESNVKSLRILRQVVEDVDRLLSALDARHIPHGPAIIEAVRLFCALSIAYRASEISDGDLVRRGDRINSYHFSLARNKSDDVAPPIIALAERHKLVRFSSSVLNDDVITQTISFGNFDPRRINESLDNSEFFAEKGKLPAWRLVMNFNALDDVTVNAAIEEMWRQFTERQFVQSGEILHVVALQMMLVTRGVIDGTINDVANEALCYIDDLLRQGRLPPRERGHRWAETFGRSHDGVQYWVEDEYRDEFQRVFDHLVHQRTVAVEKNLIDSVPDLLEVMKVDGEKFFEKLCYTRDGSLEFDDLPVLAHIPVELFVEFWLNSNRAGWYWIAHTLKERKRAAAQYPALESEALWVLAVVRSMKRIAAREKGVRKLRIERTLELVGETEHSDPGADEDAGGERK
ncbi:P-loop NTPase fold protein [Phreatobacter sp.]|uniref:P-loop NTPase fold protein n=1 Tax=Phreatobacter sp. TaxID=1966341 RepID=UPI0025DB7A19|nr:P-loop NTPase fold protein [Phreatobacter sp.]